ncbi:MAG: hypothetical protein CUR32_11420 [Flavobacterium sp.]|nr:MAG: hypothetical protein CUR32_11420 [Flavobacterium sp.] [Flavobacterium sp. FEMGT703F]
MPYKKIKILDYECTIIENFKDLLTLIIEKGDYQQIINLDPKRFEDLLSYLKFIQTPSNPLIHPRRRRSITDIDWTVSSVQSTHIYHLGSMKMNTRIIEPNPVEALYIAIPQKKLSLTTIEKIQNACGELMEAMGFEMEQKEEPVMGSFFQKSWWKKKLGLAGSEIDDVYNQTKRALLIQHQNLPNAEATEKLATAAANFLNSIKEVETVAARFGSLIVVKYNVDGKSGLICETLSPELTMFFESHPQLLSNPNGVFQLFENLKNNPNHFKEVTGPASADNIDF